MTSTVHNNHDAPDHLHGADCGHVVEEHFGHIDYIHDGHRRHVHEGSYEECRLVAHQIVDEPRPHGGGGAPRGRVDEP